METGHNKPKSRAQKPGQAKSSPNKSSPTKSGPNKPEHAKSGSKKPGHSNSGPKKPGHSKSGPKKPGHAKPGAGRAATKKSGPSKPWSKNKPATNTKGGAQRSNGQNRTSRPQPSPEETKLVLFNKPFQVICQFSPDGDKETLADYMHIPDVYPAGRLDYESEGLMLLTNNGKLQHKISHPSAKMEKTYAVQVEGVPTEEQLATLRDGVVLNDGKTLPSKVKIMENQTPFPERDPPIRERKSVPDTWIELIISEGRNRQVRRMTAAVGLPTLRLIRIKVGEYELATLAPGEWNIRKNIKF